MPGGDRTGPMGQGAMTGRTMGFCGGYDTPGYTKGYGTARGVAMGRRGGGFGRGRGFGPGRGIRGWFQPSTDPEPWMGAGMSKKDEAKMLKAQAENLRDSLKNIEDRLKDMEA